MNNRSNITKWSLNLQFTGVNSNGHNYYDANANMNISRLEVFKAAR